MEYRSLGRTGVKVSALCLGCMNFGGRTDEVGTAWIIDRALDRGINFLDTANVYSRGRSEEAVGKALKSNGKRDRVVLATTQLLSEPSFRVLETVEVLASEKGCTPSQLALAWVMNQPGVTSPIIGPRTLDQLEDNLGALEVTITDRTGPTSTR